MAVERLADLSGGQRRAIHARAERPAGPADDDERDSGIGGRGLRVIGERGGELGVERVQHRGAIQRDPGDPLFDRVGDGNVRIVEPAHDDVRSRPARSTQAVPMDSAT